MERSPGLVPSGIVCAVLLWFAGDEGGFRGTTWMPASLLPLAVLLVCLVALPRPRPSRAAFTAVLLWRGRGLVAAVDRLGGPGGARSYVPVSERTRRLVSGGVLAAVVLVVAAGFVGYWAVERSPISAASDGWNEFKEGGSDPVTSVRLGASFST